MLARLIIPLYVIVMKSSDFRRRELIDEIQGKSNAYNEKISQRAGL